MKRDLFQYVKMIDTTSHLVAAWDKRLNSKIPRSLKFEMLLNFSMQGKVEQTMHLLSLIDYSHKYSNDISHITSHICL